MKLAYKKNQAFTLIELLVVVAIVGLLSAVIMSSLNSARGKGRDAKRLADVEQIRTALQLYWVDNGGTYPSTGSSSSWHGTCSGFGSYGTTGAGGYIPGLAPTYIPVLPTDPLPNGNSGCYVYTSNGTDYMFVTYTTVEGTVPDSLKRPKATGEKDYTIYTPGASAW